MENKKIVFADLDGTLIETLSGETHPKGVWDCKLKLDVWKKIKMRFPDMTHFFIVSNQGGIEKGLVNKENFSYKYEWILAGLAEWFGKKGLVVQGVACSSNNPESHHRKPNTGMLEDILNDHFSINPDKSEMVMIGDASGKEGDWSDSDKKTAENFGIDYIDVRDL